MARASYYEEREAMKARASQPGFPQILWPNLWITLGEKIAADIIAAIQSGANVPPKQLAVLLRDGCPLPQDVRDHIAGRLDGSIKPRGRPVAHLHDNRANMDAFDAAIWQEEIQEKYREEHAANRQLKKDDPDAYKKLCKSVGRPRATPEQLTYAMLAYTHGVTYDKIRNAVKRPLQKKDWIDRAISSAAPHAIQRRKNSG